MIYIKALIRKIFKRKKNLLKRLVSDLQYVTPEFLKSIIEKYGNENVGLAADQYQKEMNKAQLSYFDKIQSNGNENKSI